MNTNTPNLNLGHELRNMNLSHYFANVFTLPTIFSEKSTVNRPDNFSSVNFEKRNMVYLSWLPNLQNWVMFDGGYIWKNLENETKCKLGRHYTTLLCPLYFNLLYVDSFGYSDMFPALYF